MRFAVPESRTKFLLYVWLAEMRGLIVLEMQRQGSMTVTLDEEESLTQLRATRSGAELMAKGDLDPDVTADLMEFIAAVGKMEIEAMAERNTSRPN